MIVRVGDIEIGRVEESLGPGFDPAFLFPDWDPEVLRTHAGWLVPNYFDVASGKLMSSVHTWVVRTPRHLVLIDTCTGNHKARPAFPRFHMLETAYLARLQAAGVRPEDVDFVLCTHLHVDHVGWNTRLQDGRWVPTFPNAKYVFSAVEHAHWDPSSRPDANSGVNENVYQDSVLPVVEAGRAMLADGVTEVDHWLRIEPAPGHTPGHVAVHASSRGEESLFTGDAMHHPLQLTRPEWNSRFCELPDAARATRRRLLEHCCERHALLMPAHFGRPHFGYVEADGDAFRTEWMSGKR